MSKATIRPESAKVTYEKEVTPDDIINEADRIYLELKARKISARDTDGLDAFYKEMYGLHKEFAVAYPLVLKYLCQLGLYDSGVLRRYIKKAGVTALRSESDYLDLQTDYVVMLYKHTTPHWDRKRAASLRTDVRAQLQRETDDFKAVAKKYADDQKKREAENDESNRKDFAQFFKEHEEFFMTDGAIPIVAKSDVVASDAASLILERELRRIEETDNADEEHDLSLYLDD